MFIDGRTGVSSWRVITWFYFLWNLFFVTRDLKVLRDREEPELFTHIHDFTTLFYVILRRKFRVVYAQWRMYVIICNIQPFAILLSSNSVSSVIIAY